jgi:S1-C subfamily serine protease
MLSCLLLTLTTGQAPAKIPEAIEKAGLAATIRVSTGATEGSGVLICRVPAASYALTAAHLVKGRDKASITLFSEAPGKPPLVATIDKEMMTAVAGSDLAVIRIEDPAGRLLDREIEFAPKTKRTPFPAFSIGLPGADRNLIRVEKALAAQEVTKENVTAKFWKCADVPAGGRSGGPLLDGAGKLIGICSGGDDKSGYYSHLDAIRELVSHSGIPIYPK